MTVRATVEVHLSCKGTSYGGRLVPFFSKVRATVEVHLLLKGTCYGVKVYLYFVKVRALVEMYLFFLKTGDTVDLFFSGVLSLLKELYTSSSRTDFGKTESSPYY